MTIVEIFNKIEELRPYISAALTGANLKLDVTNQEKVKDLYRVIVPGFNPRGGSSCNRCYEMWLIGLNTYYEQHLAEYIKATEEPIVIEEPVKQEQVVKKVTKGRKKS